VVDTTGAVTSNRVAVFVTEEHTASVAIPVDQKHEELVSSILEDLDFVQSSLDTLSREIPDSEDTSLDQGSPVPQQEEWVLEQKVEPIVVISQKKKKKKKRVPQVYVFYFCFD
jgi:hypothetical protein